MTCEIVHGDMLELLPTWAADGILLFDTIITDPPYHLASIAKRFGKAGSAPAKHGRDGAAARLSRGFMGATTDEGDISFRPETWKACMDVLAPGGRCLVFGGTRTWWKTAAAMDAAGLEIEDTIAWVYGQGLVLQRTRMKPCFEPIISARKKGPARHLNIDECRVPAIGEIVDQRLDESAITRQYNDRGGTNFAAKPGARRVKAKSGDAVAAVGRWPGNLIHDGSDDVLGCFPGDEARYFNSSQPTQEERLLYHGKAPAPERVFRCDVCGQHAFRREREAHAHGMPDWSHLREHATVKPLALLEHLVKLFTPVGGLVLDPFAGTCGLGVAAIRTGRNAICVEREAIHVTTGQLRIKNSCIVSKNV